MRERPECHSKFAPHSVCPGEALSAPGWEYITAL